MTTMTTHFAFNSGSASASPICGENNWSSICNSIPATNCFHCVSAYNEMREKEEVRRIKCEKPLQGYFDSYKCGFITLDEYANLVFDLVLTSKLEA